MWKIWFARIERDVIARSAFLPRSQSRLPNSAANYPRRIHAKTHQLEVFRSIRHIGSPSYANPIRRLVRRLQLELITEIKEVIY